MTITAPVGETVEVTVSPALPPASTQPDWGDWRSVVGWWFGPLVRPATWAAAGYLTAGFFASMLWLAVVIVLLAISIPLVIVLIGLPLSWLAFAAIDAIARVERRRARWLSVEIGPRRRLVAEGRWPRLTVRLRDPARWRQAGFLFSGFFVAMIFFSLALAAWVLSVAVIGAYFAGVGVSTLGLQVILSVIMLGVAPRLTVGLAHGYARVTAWFLGPDQMMVMRQRVDTLAGHRQEILDAVADERRRIERNLHDGVQQRLVALGIDLGLASSKLPEDAAAAKVLVDAAREKARTSIGELRVIGRGLHPAILEDRGLDAALSAVVSDSVVPIALNIPAGLRVPVDVEETAYFVASEAISNIMKHSRARAASILVSDDGHSLIMSIHDDGTGGADMAHGSGLVGLAARVHGIDGRFDVVSPSGGPTTISVELPYG